MFFPSDTHRGALQLSPHISSLYWVSEDASLHPSNFMNFVFLIPNTSLVSGMIKGNFGVRLLGQSAESNSVFFRRRADDSEAQTKCENMEEESLLSVFWKLLLYWDLDVKPSPGWSKKGKVSSEWPFSLQTCLEDASGQMNC